MTYYKVLGENGESYHGGIGTWSVPTQNADGTWTPGTWLAVRGKIVACENGLHAAKRDTLIEWLGPTIWEIEFAAEPIDAGDKVVGRKARLVRGFPQWNERSARIFAVECAESVLDNIADESIRLTCEAALYVARCYADGEATADELSAAWSASWSAAWSAPRSASRSAAESAAWTLARSASWSASRSASRSAPWSASRSASRSAPRSAQTDRLMALLGEP